MEKNRIEQNRIEQNRIEYNRIECLFPSTKFTPSLSPVSKGKPDYGNARNFFDPVFQIRNPELRIQEDIYGSGRIRILSGNIYSHLKNCHQICTLVVSH